MKTCREIMTRDVSVCEETAPVYDLAHLMRVKDVGPIPIVESVKTRKVSGIVTDRDIVLKVVAQGRDPQHTTAKEIMTRPPVTCHPDDFVDTALSVMEQNQVRRILVINGQDQLVGIISEADIATRLHMHDKTAELVEAISREKFTTAAR